MQLKKTKKKGSLINEVRTFSNGYFSFNNIDIVCYSEVHNSVLLYVEGGPMTILTLNQTWGMRRLLCMYFGDKNPT